MDAQPAPGGKRHIPDTPDREASAAKRRLIPATQGVPHNFSLVGSPKQKAYKP